MTTGGLPVLKRYMAGTLKKNWAGSLKKKNLTTNRWVAGIKGVLGRHLEKQLGKLTKKKKTQKKQMGCRY